MACCLDAVDVAARGSTRLAGGPRRFRDGVRSTQIYMVLLVVFCTNAVNIYAGVNGLECGQVYVIACSILAMAAIELQHNQNENYTLSIVFLPPFIATTLALLRSNWYPARVFVGDTYTNYAGMALAVVRSRRPTSVPSFDATRVHQTRSWVVYFSNLMLRAGRDSRPFSRHAFTVDAAAAHKLLGVHPAAVQAAAVSSPSVAHL